MSQFMLEDWMETKGSLGTVEQCLMESEKIKMNTQNPFIREQKDICKRYRTQKMLE